MWPISICGHNHCQSEGAGTIIQLVPNMSTASYLHEPAQEVCTQGPGPGSRNMLEEVCGTDPHGGAKHQGPSETRKRLQCHIVQSICKHHHGCVVEKCCPTARTAVFYLNAISEVCSKVCATNFAKYVQRCAEQLTQPHKGAGSPSTREG